MATFYRTHKKKEIPYVFSGDGGLYTAGRWNHKGQKIVYCSESLALATIEWLAHNGLSVSGFSYHKFAIEIPDDQLVKFNVSQLPVGWDSEPAVTISRDFSDQHLFKVSGPLAIAVPSIIVPEEYNLLLNPFHDKFGTALNGVKYLGEYKAPIRI